MKTPVYLAIDGNHTGKHLERYILLNDMAGLRNFNAAISDMIQRLEIAINSLGGMIYLSGGDNILAQIDSEWLPEIHHILSTLNISGYSFSMAIADSPQNAYIGLKYAKCAGENNIRVIRTRHGKIHFERL